jgi:hypothetical protein
VAWRRRTLLLAAVHSSSSHMRRTAYVGVVITRDSMQHRVKSLNTRPLLRPCDYWPTDLRLAYLQTHRSYRPKTAVTSESKAFLVEKVNFYKYAHLTVWPVTLWRQTRRERRKIIIIIIIIIIIMMRDVVTGTTFITQKTENILLWRFPSYARSSFQRRWAGGNVELCEVKKAQVHLIFI